MMGLSATTGLPLFLGATYVVGFMIGDDLTGSAIAGAAIALVSPIVSLVALALIGRTPRPDDQVLRLPVR